MSVPYIVYDVASGRILGSGAAPDLATALLHAPAAGTAVLAGVGGRVPPGAWYVDPAGSTRLAIGTGEDLYFRDYPGALTPRPALPAWSKLAILANGTDQAVLTGLPAGATVSVDGGAPAAVTGGEVRVASTMAASYAILVACWPYLDLGVIVTCS